MNANVLDDDSKEWSISELQEAFANASLSSRSITELYLKRIEEMNLKGPALHAVISTNAHARADAEKLDAERASGMVRGSLHGIPCLIKDNVNTHDLPTTAGSLALRDFHPATDAFIVQQLKKAGMVILGKTNLSEWANIRSTHSVSGWSAMGGQTKNPYVLDRNPSGSSSGSAVAVAANLCAIAIGTETDGSIISPASHCGIVGLKPTVGLVSRSGIIPIAVSQDTAGPMARSVRDCATVLNVMCELDTNDTAMRNSNRPQKVDYTHALSTNALKGKRIGIDTRFLSTRPRLKKAFVQAIDNMKRLGASIVECSILKLVAQVDNEEGIILLYEFKHGLNDYLRSNKAPVSSLKELIEFNVKNVDLEMPFFAQDVFEDAQACGELSDVPYKKAREACDVFRQKIDALMKDQKLDALCGLSGGAAGCIDLINGDYSTGSSFSSPAAICGYPSITIPCGFAEELPLGLCLMSSAWQEEKLLAMAYAYEQESLARQQPKYKATVIR